MKKKLPLFTFLLSSFLINACDNNTLEPTGNDYFYCDGSDRVIVKSLGLTHANILDSTVFEYNNEIYNLLGEKFL